MLCGAGGVPNDPSHAPDGLVFVRAPVVPPRDGSEKGNSTGALSYPLVAIMLLVITAVSGVFHVHLV